MKRFLIWVPLFFLLTGCMGSLIPSNTFQATQPVDISAIQFTNTASICPTCEPVISQTPVIITTTPLPTFTPTNTLQPTNTFTATFTKTATATKKPTNTTVPKIYEVHEDAPIYLTNVIYLDSGCNWIGIVGQVFGSDGLPVRGTLVMVRGVKADGTPVEIMTLTGLAKGYKAPNAYEIKLSDAVFESINTYYIAVYDMQYRLLSEPFYFSTFADCGKNMIMVNFKTIQ